MGHQAWTFYGELGGNGGSTSKLHRRQQGDIAAATRRAQLPLVFAATRRASQLLGSAAI